MLGLEGEAAFPEHGASRGLCSQLGLVKWEIMSGMSGQRGEIPRHVRIGERDELKHGC